MEIRGTSPIHGSQAIRAPHSVNSVNTTQSVSHPDVVDQLDISAEAQAASRAGEVGGTEEIRAAKVAEIKAQIAEGTYETPEKLDAAVSRMLDEWA